jgi:hypothetical protein
MVRRTPARKVYGPGQLTPTVERQLLSDLSVVYAGYFVSLSDQGKLADAFRVIERARGRVEAQALAHHEVIPPREPNPAEEHLTNLNVELLDTDDEVGREHILDAIYSTEQLLDVGSQAGEERSTAVSLGELQRDLRTSEILVEYVLANPHSYALAVTQSSVRRYTLPSKDDLEAEVGRYRAELMYQKTDQSRGKELFDWLLGEIPELKEKRALIVVSDGNLHLLPISALMNQGHYDLTSRLVTVCPSGTVLHFPAHRADRVSRDDLPYVGAGKKCGSRWFRGPRRDILGVDGREITAPEHPAFPMGKQSSVEIVGRDDRRRTVSVDVAPAKGKKLHFVEPRLVEAPSWEALRDT